MADILNVSTDGNENDTSEDEMDIDFECEPCGPSSMGELYQFIEKEFATWRRPEPPIESLFFISSVLEAQPEPFSFYLLDSVSSVSSVKHPKIQLDELVTSLSLHNVIRLFGLISYDDKSYSVACNVHGFVPYFYVLPISKDFEEEEVVWTPENVNLLQRFLNEELKTRLLADISCIEYHDFLMTNPCILRIETTNASQEKGIFDFLETKPGMAKSLLLKIYVSLSKFIWVANEFFECAELQNCTFQCFESTINNNIRFLTDQNIYVASWYRLSEGKYYLRSEKESPIKETYSQIELDVHVSDITYVAKGQGENCTNSLLKIPALRVLSFDIEVLVKPNSPVPRNGDQQIIQIATVLGKILPNSTTQDPTTTVIGRSTFVLGHCDYVPDSKTVQFYLKENPTSMNSEAMKKPEALMLAYWRDLVLLADPDIITGYNIKTFDLPYIFDRSSILDYWELWKVPFLTRVKKVKSHVRNIQNDLKKSHRYDQKQITIPGRILFDLYPLMGRHDRRSSDKGYLTLAQVARRFLSLENGKLDVTHQEIEALHMKNKSTRKRLAEYCLQDATIPYLLLFQPVPCRKNRISFVDLYMEKCTLGGTLLRYMVNKSITYNDYFKRVRVEKNPNTAKFLPDTPSPVRMVHVFNSRNHQ